jgi:hypothetical protein
MAGIVINPVTASQQLHSYILLAFYGGMQPQSHRGSNMQHHDSKFHSRRTAAAGLLLRVKRCISLRAPSSTVSEADGSDAAPELHFSVKRRPTLMNEGQQNVQR